MLVYAAVLATPRFAKQAAARGRLGNAPSPFTVALLVVWDGPLWMANFVAYLVIFSIELPFVLSRFSLFNLSASGLLRCDHGSTV